MNLDLSSALEDIADDARRGADLGPVDQIVTRRRRRRIARRGAGTAVGLALVSGIALAGTSLADWKDATTPLPAATESPSPTPTPDPVPDPAPEPTDDAPATSAPPPETSTDAPDVPPSAALPLVDPYESRWRDVGFPRADIISDAPQSATELEDGDFYGFLLDVDPAAGTVTVDLAIFYGGTSADAELDKLGVPEIDRAAGYWITNEVTRPRVLPLSPDLVVTGYCTTPDGVQMRARTLEQVGASTGSSPGCAAESRTGDETDGGSDFWVDVRGGEVVQIVGQFLP